jgi:hypothetical protein
VTVFAESEALHASVRAFAHAALHGRPDDATFDALALRIATYQAKTIPGFARLVAASGGRLDRVEAVPAVPVDAFRATRVAAHDAAHDVARFTTSGTTGAARGLHAMRTTATYRELSLAWGRRALLPRDAGRRAVVALAPPPEPSPASSLAFMMQAFMEELDGAPLAPAQPGGAKGSGRWLAGPGGVDVDGAKRAVEAARRRGDPLLVLATGFALVLLTDALAGRTLDAPPGSVVMPTGGTKGRTREASPAELVERAALAFGVPETHVVGEYGMTELTSQLYEGTLPGGAIAAPRGTFVPPPWLRVVAVDPADLSPVPPGEAGIARFVDLGNVDSAVAVVTQDVVRVTPDGIVLQGRLPGAPPRGCSLAMEEMVLAAGAE